MVINSVSEFVFICFHSDNTRSVKTMHCHSFTEGGEHLFNLDSSIIRVENDNHLLNRSTYEQKQHIFDLMCIDSY
jgi:hypothetical protein